MYGELGPEASENYSETFRNDFVEVKNRKELLRNLEWAKELKSLLTIKEVVSENDAVIIVIEESKNYIDDALKRKPRKFKTTYYLKDGKIQIFLLIEHKFRKFNIRNIL